MERKFKINRDEYRIPRIILEPFGWYKNYLGQLIWISKNALENPHRTHYCCFYNEEKNTIYEGYIRIQNTINPPKLISILYGILSHDLGIYSE